jgi:hypothetical protein
MVFANLAADNILNISKIQGKQQGQQGFYEKHQVGDTNK